MLRTERIVRVNPKDDACTARTQRTGEKTWRVDSCREHLECSFSQGARYRCTARKTQ